MKPRDRPTVPDVLPLLEAIYADHPAGCCLHILTDDYNVDDGHARFCLQEAIESDHPTCISAAEMLLRMTETQRLRASHKVGKGRW